MSHTHQLSIRDIYASVLGKEILHGISLSIKSNEVHVVMGPNGSGKSTLTNVIAGNPVYQIFNGNHKKTRIIFFDSTDISKYSVDQRARKRIFLAFQNPVTIPGVTIIELLKTAYQEIYGRSKFILPKSFHNPALLNTWNITDLSVSEFIQHIRKNAQKLHIHEDLLRRPVNEGFSGGEKKKMEMLQVLVLQPSFSLFDEIDTGLDIDALKIITESIVNLKNHHCGILLVTHYTRILKYIHPDVVHILVNGKIVDQGNAKLAQKIDSQGYSKYMSRVI